MMYLSQRLLALFLCLICLVSALCGCQTTPSGDKTTSASSDTAPTTTDTITTEAITTEEPVTTEEPEPVLPDIELTECTVLNGEFQVGSNISSKAANSLALLGNYERGKFSVSIRPTHTGKVGLVFGYTKTENGESYYRFTTSKASECVCLERVTNGVATVLYENFLSRGHSINGTYLYQIILSDDAVYCYLGELMYTFTKEERSGHGIGIYAAGSGTVFVGAKINEGNTRPIRKDTLIIGHSYLEGWSSWATSLAGTIQKYDLGDTVNLGISGSWASHWYAMRECLALYRPKTVIFMIGINDIMWGGMGSIIRNVKDTLEYIHEANPQMEAVLFTVNHCPFSDSLNKRNGIKMTNLLFRDICDKNDWIYCADIEHAFSDANNVPLAHWFSDGLHPNTNGYNIIIVPALRKALEERNKNS